MVGQGFRGGAHRILAVSAVKALTLHRNLLHSARLGNRRTNIRDPTQQFRLSLTQAISRLSGRKYAFCALIVYNGIVIELLRHDDDPQLSVILTVFLMLNNEGLMAQHLLWNNCSN